MCYTFGLMRWPLLTRYPALKTLAWFNDDPKQHLGVLRAAVLRTLPEVHADVVRLDPHAVLSIGNQIRLSRHLWNPETVNGVRRQQRDVRRRGMTGIAQRHVKFVGRDETVLRVPKLPPELMADGGGLGRIRRKVRVLNGVDHSRGRQE